MHVHVVVVVVHVHAHVHALALVSVPPATWCRQVWLFSVPWGLRKLLNWIDRRYGKPPIYVTENGWSTPGAESAAEGVVDDGRVLFYHNYTGEMQRAIYEDGVDVSGA